MALLDNINIFKQKVNKDINQIKNNINTLLNLIQNGGNNNSSNNNSTLSESDATDSPNTEFNSSTSGAIDEKVILQILKRLQYLENRLGGYELYLGDSTTIDFFVNMLPNNSSIDYIFSEESPYGNFWNDLEKDLVESFLTTFTYSQWDGDEYKILKTFEDWIKYTLGIGYGLPGSLSMINWYGLNFNKIDYFENAIDALALADYTNYQQGSAYTFYGIKGVIMQPMSPITKYKEPYTTYDELVNLLQDKSNIAEYAKEGWWEIHYQPNVYEMKNGEYVSLQSTPIRQEYNNLGFAYSSSTEDLARGTDFKSKNFNETIDGKIKYKNKNYYMVFPSVAKSDENWYKWILLGYYPRKVTRTTFIDIIEHNYPVWIDDMLAGISSDDNINDGYIFKKDTSSPGLPILKIKNSVKYTYIPAKVNTSRIENDNGYSTFYTDGWTYLGLNLVNGHQWTYLENLVNSYITATSSVGLSSTEFVLLPIYSAFSTSPRNHFISCAPYNASAYPTLKYDNGYFKTNNSGILQWYPSSAPEVSEDGSAISSRVWSVSPEDLQDMQDNNAAEFTALYYNATESNKVLCKRLNIFIQEFIKNSNNPKKDITEYDFNTLYDMYHYASVLISNFTSWRKLIPDYTLLWKSSNVDNIVKKDEHDNYCIDIEHSSGGNATKYNIISNPFSLISIREDFEGPADPTLPAYLRAEYTNINITKINNEELKFKYRLYPMLRPLYLSNSFKMHWDWIDESVRTFECYAGDFIFDTASKKLILNTNYPAYQLEKLSLKNININTGASYSPYGEYKILILNNSNYKNNNKEVFGNDWITNYNGKNFKEGSDDIIVFDMLDGHYLKAINDNYKEICISWYLPSCDSLEWRSGQTSWNNYTYPSLYSRYRSFHYDWTGEPVPGTTNHINTIKYPKWVNTSGNAPQEINNLPDFEIGPVDSNGQAPWLTEYQSGLPKLKWIGPKNGNESDGAYIEWVCVNVMKTSYNRTYKINTNNKIVETTIKVN